MPAMNKGLSVYFALAFVRWLNTPFEKWPEFEVGLIDKDGKVLRDPENSEEKKMKNIFSNLVRKLKILLGKLPGGKSRLASALATAALLKEEYEFDENILITELEKIWPEEKYQTPIVFESTETFTHTIYNEILEKSSFRAVIQDRSTIEFGKYRLAKLETTKGTIYI